MLAKLVNRVQDFVHSFQWNLGSSFWNFCCYFWADCRIVFRKSYLLWENSVKILRESFCLRLPYTQATVFEVFRLSNILPISGPRKAMKDFQYGDFLIKKDTAISFNTYTPMRSKKVWGDPDNFRPERFLDSNGKLNNLHEQLSVIFGHGWR